MNFFIIHTVPGRLEGRKEDFLLLFRGIPSTGSIWRFFYCKNSDLCPSVLTLVRHLWNNLIRNRRINEKVVLTESGSGEVNSVKVLNEEKQVKIYTRDGVDGQTQNTSEDTVHFE